MSEYRLHITVPGIPLQREDLWEPLIELLERDHDALGPVLGWHDTATVWIIVATDAPSEAAAVRVGVDAVVDALVQVGLGTVYPTAVEAETVERELEPA